MSSHNDKVPDKLMSSSSSHKTSREKQNANRGGQEKKMTARQDQKSDNKYKSKSQKKIEQEQKPVINQEPEHKVDNRHSLGQDNKYEVNNTHQKEELRPDTQFSLNTSGKNNVNQKDDENQQKKDDYRGDQPLIANPINPISDTPREDIQPQGSADGIIEDIDNNLPPTAVLLTTKGGSKVYVVGTVHFSLESQKDVADVIKAVQPDFLVLELCLSRAYMLQWNEEHIYKEAKQMNFKTMKQVIQRAGIVQGGLYLLMLSMTIEITKQLGIAPGGEFRTAYREAMGIPNCVVWFGDRPLEITLHRMLASLSLWQMTKLFFVVLFNNEKISKEDVENCKNSDILERMMLSISKELPDFAHVILNERDLYLTYSLQIAAERSEPNKVVGVVGIGHLAGIKKNWGKVSAEDVHKILTIPPPRRSTKIIKFVFKFAAVGLVVYGVHKLASRNQNYANLFSDQSYWNLSNMMYDIWESPVIQHIT